MKHEIPSRKKDLFCSTDIQSIARFSEFRLINTKLLTGRILVAQCLHCLLTVMLAFVGVFPGKGQDIPPSSYPDSLMPERLKTVIIAESVFYVGGLLYLNNIWYKDHESVPFHFYNDNRGWMQIDKAGHMYTAYYQSYYGMKALRWAGVAKKKALWFGGMMGIVLQTPIEIFDGLYEGYGFSAGDMIANAAGTALGGAAHPDEIFLFSFRIPTVPPFLFRRISRGKFFYRL